MDFQLPELGEGVYEAELTAWQVRVGDNVRRGQNLMEVMTDKATMEVPSPFAGTISALLAEPGSSIKVGTVVLSYTTADQPSATTSAAKPNGRRERAPLETAPLANPSIARASAAPAGVMAAPSVRHMARKLGIDLTRVRGSGPSGRILIEDLTPIVQPAASQKTEKPAAPAVDYGKPGDRIKLRGLRGKIAERMVHSKRTIPHYTYVDEFDVSELVRLRDSLRGGLSQSGIKLTYLAFVVKAVVAALKEIPIVNASLEDEAGEIVLHTPYHIGIAVASPSGLIVPVIHDADQKDLIQVAREISRLSDDARTGKSKLEDLRGGTFTITSIGNIGGLFSTPVINHPQVAILGVGKIVKRPVFDAQGSIRPADMVYLSLSCDHRVLDGAIGAAFANAVGKRLQNPALLLLPEPRA
jgi:pyruvate dehydrogenase E2 component (dihydrolipoamide acetyltransferase)/2-oxoisovalerate dehydrogenase E2 component (dihydrolipoyl transacylase)